MVKRTLKKLLPASLKIALHQTKNNFRDWRRGHVFSKPKSHAYPPVFTLTQDLKHTDAKTHNLKLATGSIAKVVVEPGEVFSFWKAVGPATKKRGYVSSRSLLDGEIRESIGGGLCQLAGMVYYGALHLPTQIIERYPHSLDIYTPETRFTPLGSDATVAYGYKDLKVKNTSDQPLAFSFEISQDKITLHVHSDKPLDALDVSFAPEVAAPNRVAVSTWVNGEKVAHSDYGLPPKA